jgi:hypothetical protein
MRFLTPINLTRVAQVTAGWGVIFAVVHAYWAAGGAAGMNGEPAGAAGVQAYIAFIAVLGLLGAAVAAGLVPGSRPRPGRRLLIPLARAGGAALLLGVAFSTGRWLVVGSLEGDGATGVVITLYFLLGGLLFSTLGWRRDTLAFSRSGGRPG